VPRLGLALGQGQDTQRSEDHNHSSGEETLARAKTLAASGHLREALAALEDIRATDPQKGDGDRLRGDIQQQLMTLSSIVPVAAPDREKGERPNP